MEEHPLSLYELNALVKRSIHACAARVLIGFRQS